MEADLPIPKRDYVHRRYSEQIDFRKEITGNYTLIFSIGSALVGGVVFLLLEFLKSKPDLKLDSAMIWVYVVMLVSFLASAVQFLRGQAETEELYFDAIANFLFLFGAFSLALQTFRNPLNLDAFFAETPIAFAIYSLFEIFWAFVYISRCFTGRKSKTMPSADKFGLYQSQLVQYYRSQDPQVAKSNVAQRIAHDLEAYEIKEMEEVATILFENNITRNQNVYLAKTKVISSGLGFMLFGIAIAIMRLYGGNQ